MEYKDNVVKNIFKYGPSQNIKYIQPSTRNLLYVNNIEDSLKEYVDNKLSKDIDNSITNFFSSTTNVNNIFNSDTFIDNIVNVFEEIIINNQNITNIINNNIEIPHDLEINSLTLFSTNLDRISIKSNTQIEDNLIIANENFFPDLTIYNNYGIITDKPFYIDNKITISNIDLEVINNELFFNGTRIKNIDNDEIYNNISPFSIDDNENTYTFSNISINTSNNTNYNLTVNGTANITNKLYLGINNDYINVNNGNLYFNNHLITTNNYKGIKIYFCFDYNTVDINELETLLIIELNSNGIDTSYMVFTFDDIITVNINIRTDICLNSEYQDNIIGEINKIYNLVVNGNLVLTIDNIKKIAVPEIYLYNKYYYFSDLSKNNAFKLVKRNNITYNKSILNGDQVYLININGLYLQKDYTYTTNNSNNLLLQVHAYTNNFLTDNTICFINIIDSFKLEILPGSIYEELCSGITSGITSNCYNNIILGNGILPENLINDTTWSNIGINPTYLTTEIFLATNISDYITNPSIYNNIYLVDQKWLTVIEINNITIWNETYNNNHNDSKKFINGYEFCHNSNTPDYVFHKSYNLENIDEHAKYMFNNNHLCAITDSRFYKEKIDLRREQILEELEKAHIYIFQLHERIKLLEHK